MQKYRTDIFTPPTIAKKIIEQHKRFSTNTNNVLEPSAGIGNLIDVMLSVYKQIDAYEINEKYVKTLQQKYTQPTIQIWHKDFLETTPNKHYDNIIMNPPYLRI